MPELTGADAPPEGPPAGYIELYTFAVEMADRISARRGAANSFFLTINTGLAALLGGQDLRWYVAVAGIVLCVTWWSLLQSYRDLNAAKFEVILAMETQLPARPFGDEWARLRRVPVKPTRQRDAVRAWFAQYRELGRIERVVPCVFVLIYVVEILRQATA